jgi:hypothetical protein
MEPVMGPAMGQGTKGSDLKMAPALDLRNNALDPQTFDIGTGADSYIGDCPSLFIEFHSLAKGILIPIASIDITHKYCDIFLEGIPHVGVGSTHQKTSELRCPQSGTLRDFRADSMSELLDSPEDQWSAALLTPDSSVG